MSARESYTYTDPTDAFGHTLHVNYVDASTYDGNRPVVALAVTVPDDATDPENPVVYVPVEDVERVVTAIRTAAGHAPAPDAEPDFFQVGRTYTRGATPWKAPELIEVFRPEHITVHPEHGFRRAIGWVRTGEPGAKWHGHFVDEAEFIEWTETRGAES